jgi:hypothetical protein
MTQGKEKGEGREGERHERKILPGNGVTPINF